MYFYPKNKMVFQSATFIRKFLSNVLDELSLEQLNKIPDGFNNNILWNIAHILVTEQMLTYGLSNLPITMKPEFISKFKKGSKCLSNYTNEDVQLIKNEYLKLNNKTKQDYQENLFVNFTKYPTSTNIVLNNVDEALQFNTLHEGIHLGVILSIKKQV
jgi:hypothetical protein